MKERQEFLDKHPYKVTLGKDGYWRTYFPDDTQKGGRKLVKKKDKKNIENAIVSFYRLKVENPTIKQVFTEWNDRRFKLNKIAASTHERDGQVFRRHYKEMGKRRIRMSDQMNLQIFSKSKLRNVILQQRLSQT